MKPTIGTVVTYNTTNDEQTEMINNPDCNVQEKLPAIIVAVHSEESVNLKVFLDGKGELWVTSSLKGDDEGQWNCCE